jgi:hypothetical protein
MRQNMPIGQACPHIPQFAGSMLSDVQRSGQSVSPIPHVHAPAVHPASGGHIIPHAPQFCALVIRFTHAPAHIVCPVGHVAAQAPATQN